MFRSSIADWNTIPSGSMIPNLQIGDRVYVNKLAYDLRWPLTSLSIWHFEDPERGDVVVFDSKSAAKKLIKRVIGIPGDTVALRDNQLWVNGEAAHYQPVQNNTDSKVPHTASNQLFSESHLERETIIRIDTRGASPLYSSFRTIIVPDKHLFVMGDNREASADSRVYGFVPFRELRGKATHVLFSLDKQRHYLPRSDRFIHKIN